MNDIPITVLCCANARLSLTAPGEVENLPPGTKVIELPCIGRIDEVTILRTLRGGAWAVLVIGCLEGNCKYLSGNYQARRRVDEARSLLQQLRMDPSRVQMCNIASNQHACLKAALAESRERAAQLGPVKVLEGDK
jgi:coenzyme F420-reducing hydrogenase delta subunit